MAYQRVISHGVEYQVDWQLIERLCLSYWRSYYQAQYARWGQGSERNANPASWAMPVFKTVDVPWDKVRADAQVACAMTMQHYRDPATAIPDIQADLLDKLTQTARAQRKFIHDFKDLQSYNLGQMETSTTRYEVMVDALTFVRDTSTDIVAIGSTIATGGAAAGLLGASSVLKGLYKYQDTGNAGVGLLYGSGSLLLGAFELGGAAEGVEKAVLIVAQGGLETGTSFAAGDSFSTAVTTGGLKVASSLASDALFKAPAVQELLQKVPIPLKVMVQRTVRQHNVADKVVQDTIPSVFGSGAGEGMKFGASVLFTRQPSPIGNGSAGQTLVSPELPPTGSGFADEVPLDKLELLDHAIVKTRAHVSVFR